MIFRHIDKGLNMSCRINKVMFYSLYLGVIIASNFMYGHVSGLPMSRLAYVMYKGHGGIESVNHRIKFADIKNLGFDLNIAEMSKRFGCKTKIGQEFLSFYLHKPISSKDLYSTILARQNMIKIFIAHRELLEKFEKLIDQAVECEDIISQFMEKRKILRFNDNPFTALDVLKKTNPYFSAWSLIATTGSIVTAPYAYLPEKAKKLGSSVVQIGSAGYALLAATTLSNMQSLGKALYEPSASDVYVHGAAGVGLAVSLALAMFNNGYASQELAWAVYSTGTSIYHIYDHYTQALQMRRALHAMNQLIKIAQEVEDLCNTFKVEHQFKLSSVRSRQGKHILSQLDHSRYQEIDSYLFLTPWVESFVYEVYEHDNIFAPVYASIAEIDVYVALARKMIQLQDKNHHITFVEFLDADQPTIHAREFWNMLVPDDKIVTNDIFEHRNIILTGSNEGGKTTAIRAILQNIVLAQTFGIAAATEFKLTQFDSIYSFLNISDDILQGKSRFASELKQAQDILQKIKNLYQGEKFFFAFDELFTGTNGEDGAQCAYEFINNVASFKGIQFIYATHFNVLKTIGSKNPACANYKIEPPLRNALGQFIRDAKGQLIYPYKLSPGANDVNVAMDRARDAGIFA